MISENSNKTLALSRLQTNKKLRLLPEQVNLILFDPVLASRIKLEVEVPHKLCHDEAHLGICQTKEEDD
jgi:hypothetical protein